jgi:hypothetical protein
MLIAPESGFNREFRGCITVRHAPYAVGKTETLVAKVSDPILLFLTASLQLSRRKNDRTLQIFSCKNNGVTVFHV